MARVRATVGYVATTALLLLAAYLGFQTYILLTEGSAPDLAIIAWGIPTTIGVLEFTTGVLAIAGFAGAVAIMARRPRRTAAAA